MQIVPLIIVLVVSVILHELAHGYVALAQGDPTAKFAGRLTLNPLAHLDPVGSFLLPLLLWSLGGVIFGWAKPVPYNPHNLRYPKWGPALVAAAGPAVNLLLALLFSLLWRLGVQQELILMVILLNLALAIFNLIPIAPLDGSKIIFALIPFRYRHIQNWLERQQLLLLIIILVLIANTSWLDWAGFRFLQFFTLLTI